jgi:predicted transcriptional regulator
VPPPRRHTNACKLLNCASSISLKKGLTELAELTKTHNSKATDLFKKALKELEEKRSWISAAAKAGTQST